MTNAAPLLTMLVSLLQNVSLLVAMSFIFSIIRPAIHARLPRCETYIVGFVFGLFSLLTMVMPVALSPGVIFDGRNIMVLIAGMFVGWRAAVVAAVVAILARFAVGGMGAFSGSVSIAVTAGLGCWAYYRLVRQQPRYSYGQLIVLGLVMAAQGLSWGLLLLPGDISGAMLRSIGLPLLILYPAGTLLIGVLLSHDFRKSELEQALRESEERFRQMAENIDQIFWIRESGTDRVLYMSPKYESIWGQSVEAIYRDTNAFVNAIHPDDRERILQERRNNALVGYQQQYRIIRSDGSQRWISTRAFPVRDSSGAIYRMAGVSEDITERRRDEERLQNFAEALERANGELEMRVEQRTHQLSEMNLELERALAREQELSALRARLVTTISHEFRTPLAVIMSSTELLRRYSQRMDETKRQERLEEILHQVQWLTRLLSDMFTFRKMNNEVSAAGEAIDLVAVCQALLDKTRPNLTAGQTLDLAVDGQPALTFLDLTLLEHIVTNLLDNAIKYSPGGGPIMLKLSFDRDEVTLAVSDQGTGIAKSDLPHLFEPFLRGENAQMVKGVGLGLAIAKRAVDALGGAISVCSEPGVGTTVSVRLPLQPVTA